MAANSPSERSRTGPRSSRPGKAGWRWPAAYPADMAGIGVANYPASGFGDGRDPGVSAVSDRSGMVGGVLAAGTPSGTRVAINGTSVAAPAVARRIALDALDGGSELAGLAGLPLQDGSDLKLRVGRGWLPSVEV